MPLQSINPTTEEVVATYTELSDGDVDTKLARAEEAFGVWKRTSFAQRKEKMLRLAQLLKQNGREIGMIATQEMGKPIIQAKAEVEKCAWVCEYYAENAEQILAHEVVATDASESYVQFDPIGVVLAVMPWNFPFWQVIRFIAPAAMAGNVGVLKHASNVQGCATKIEELFLQAGFPEGIFQNLAIGAAKVERVIQDSRVKAVTLTGSEYAGSQVAMHAGKEIKKTVLELGGSDPFIVLEDADLDPAVQTALMARLQNCGQSCIAAKRLILVESIADEFLSRLKTIFESAKIGALVSAPGDQNDRGRERQDRGLRTLHRRRLGIIHELNAGAVPERLDPVLQSFEAVQGPLKFFPREAQNGRDRDGGQNILKIMNAFETKTGGIYQKFLSAPDVRDHLSVF